MTELEKIRRAKLYIDKLAAGVDPITDAEVPGDSVLNNVRLSRCFYYVSEILRQVIDNGGTAAPPKRTAKEAFALSPEDRNAFEYTREPVQVSRFVERINGLVDMERVKKLTTTVITDWLLEKGFLTVVEQENGRKNRVPTQLGNKIGLSSETRQGQYGEYTAVFYSEDAQRFVMDHLDEIIQRRHDKTTEINVSN